jgi:hypothetical protein
MTCAKKAEKSNGKEQFLFFTPPPQLKRMGIFSTTKRNPSLAICDVGEKEDACPTGGTSLSEAGNGRKPIENE